jgi:hypothetical protein
MLNTFKMLFFAKLLNFLGIGWNYSDKDFISGKSTRESKWIPGKRQMYMNEGAYNGMGDDEYWKDI